MGIRLATFVLQARQILQMRSLNNKSSSSPVEKTANVPKGHFAVYVGEKQQNRFVIPLSYLKSPSFQELLRRAEEEYGYDPPMGGLTIPCSEDAFLNVASLLERTRSTATPLRCYATSESGAMPACSKRH